MEYYVYLHIKADTGEPFYVGKGKGYRAFEKSCRTKAWKNTVNKHGLDVIFLEENIDEHTALEREVYWIKRIGRRDLGLGPLVNFTDGGDGVSGHIKSPETLIKLKENHKGMTGKFQTEEAKRKIGQANSIALIGNTPWNKGKKEYTINGKVVLDLSTGIFYKSITEASIAYGIDNSNLTKCLKGKRKNNTNLTLI